MLSSSPLFLAFFGRGGRLIRITGDGYGWKTFVTSGPDGQKAVIIGDHGRNDVLPGRRRRGGGRGGRGGRGLGGVRDLEDDLHVEVATHAVHSLVEIPPAGGGDEVIVLSGLVLEGPGGGRERPEADGEELEVVGGVALRDDAGVAGEDAAAVVLLFVDEVDDEALGVRRVGVLSPVVQRADDVDLVVLEDGEALVHVDDVVRVVDAKPEKRK